MNPDVLSHYPVAFPVPVLSTDERVTSSIPLVEILYKLGHCSVSV